MRSKLSWVLAFVLLPLVLICLVSWRKTRGNEGGVQSQEAAISNLVVSAFNKWQEIPMVAANELDLSTFENAIPVDYYGDTTNSEHIPELRKTIFELINCYSHKSPDVFLDFWDGLQWSLDTNAIPYLLQIGENSGPASPPRMIIEKAWYKASEHNQIQALSLVAMKAQTQWTTDVGDLVMNWYRNDVAKVSKVDLPSIITIGASRSVFIVDPMPSKLIADQGKVLYAHVVLFVKYRSLRSPEGSSTVPLVLGFYWSPAHSRWIPHTKGIISTVDPVGIIF